MTQARSFWIPIAIISYVSFNLIPMRSIHSDKNTHTWKKNQVVAGNGMPRTRIGCVSCRREFRSIQQRLAVHEHTHLYYMQSQT